MPKSERFARVILKRTEIQGLSGTTGPTTNDHTIQPAWKSTDLYKGELYLNLNDERLYIRTNSGIREIPLSQFTGDPLNIYHAAQDGEGLIYNASTHTWTNEPAVGIIHSLSGLTDDVQINLSTPGTTKYFLKYEYAGAKWKNMPITLNYDINDVTVTTPSAGQILTYNGFRWINDVPTIKMYSTLSGSTDVLLSSPTSGQYLKYSGGTWINASFPISFSALTLLSDISITSPLSGEYLKYNGIQWINSAIPTLSALTLSGLIDVLINSPVNDQVLKYNTGSGKWVNSFDRTITGLTWDKYDQKLIIDYQDGYVPITIEGKPIDYITGTTKLIKGFNSTVLCYSGTTIILPTASGYTDDSYYGTIFKIKLIQSGSMTIQCEGTSDYIFDDSGIELQSISLTTLGKTITLQSDGLDTWYFI